MGTFDRGSYVAEAGYDIRVTMRCMTDDLGAESGSPLVRLSDHEIIRALRGKHEVDPVTTDTVGPAAGMLTLGTLRYGHDHRGAVWYDPANNAFWLCAYRFHRSGTADDAFPYFEQLIRENRIYPTDEDRVLLYRDRAERLIDAIPEEATRLREMAAADTGQEVRGQLGPMNVRLVIVEVSGLRELHVAVSMRSGDYNLLQLVLVALCPETDVWAAWRPETDFPAGPLDGAAVELAYSCLLD